mmetsp:Transcript_79606/g.230200  ORF Transcript_79606/g.230200 Transcript_79606/m.230200 type:complete len:440 (+) Transcript_79606:674-1993(+)
MGLLAVIIISSDMAGLYHVDLPFEQLGPVLAQKADAPHLLVPTVCRDDHPVVRPQDARQPVEEAQIVLRCQPLAIDAVEKLVRLFLLDGGQGLVRMMRVTEEHGLALPMARAIQDLVNWTVRITVFALQERLGVVVSSAAGAPSEALDPLLGVKPVSRIEHGALVRRPKGQSALGQRLHLRPQVLDLESVPGLPANGDALFQDEVGDIPNALARFAVLDLAPEHGVAPDADVDEGVRLVDGFDIVGPGVGHVDSDLVTPRGDIPEGDSLRVLLLDALEGTALVPAIFSLVDGLEQDVPLVRAGGVRPPQGLCMQLPLRLVPEGDLRVQAVVQEVRGSGSPCHPLAKLVAGVRARRHGVQVALVGLLHAARLRRLDAADSLILEVRPPALGEVVLAAPRAVPEVLPDRLALAAIVALLDVHPAIPTPAPQVQRGAGLPRD